MKKLNPPKTVFMPFLLMSVLIVLSAQSPSTFSYESVEGEDGWQMYKHPIELTIDSVQDLKPCQDSPEGAVISFYASHIKGDDSFKEIYSPVDGQDEIDDYRDWMEKLTFKTVKLLGKKALDSSRYWISIYLEVEYKNESDSGEDEVEVGRIADKWWIIKAPR